MRKSESRVLETARNVQAFLIENADIVGSSIASCRRNLDDGVARLTAMAVGQGVGHAATKGATARKKSLLVTLRKNHMRPVTLVAKQKLRNVPEFKPLSTATRHLKAALLVVAAKAMAVGAQRHEAVFTEVGLPDDFIAQLNAAADAVTVSLDGRQASRAGATSATAGLHAQEQRLRGLFQLIDAIVGPKLGTDAVLLSKWGSTKAIKRKSNDVPAPISTPVSSQEGSAAPQVSQVTAAPIEASTVALAPSVHSAA